MAFVLSDRIKETTTTTSTGTYTLGGAVSGFETFTANLSNGDTTYYCCTDGTDFEVGLGTFASSGTTLARTTIISSSNSNNAVNWSSGSRDIFCTLPGSKALALDGDNDLTFASGSQIFTTSDGSNAVMSIRGGGPNFIEFLDNTLTANGVTIAYRTTPHDLIIERRHNGSNIAEFGGDDGHAALYFDDSKKLETTSGGVTITGTLTGNVTGDLTGDVTGNVSGTAATVTGAAQSNITSVGTLTGLTTSGTINLSQTSGTAITTSGGLSSADLGILRAHAGADTHGFTIKYMGSRTGNNNSYSLFMDNQSGTDVEAMTVLQDGSVGINNTSPSARLDVVGDLELVGDVTGLTSLTVDDITINGSTISDSADLLIDVGGDIILDAAGNDFKFRDNGTEFLRITNSSSDAIIRPVADAKDIIFQQRDGTEVARVEDNGTFNVVTDKLAINGTAITATATEINKLDDVTATTTELNYVDVTTLGTVEASKAVTADANGDVLFPDNEKAKFGTGGDLEIYHSGSNSIIHETGTGALTLRSNIYNFRNAANDEQIAKFNENGSIELYHDNSKKFETTSTGATVTGDLLIQKDDDGASQDPSLVLYRNSASPADSDLTGDILFRANNDNSEVIDYAQIFSKVTDVSDGSEDGQLEFKAMRAGSLHTYAQMAFNNIYIYKQLTMFNTLYMHNSQVIQFEGATGDDHETTLTVTDPTADRTITLPDATGTVLTTGNSDTPSTTTSSSDADFVLVDDGGTMKKITPSNLGITSGGASKGFAVAMAIAL